MLPQFLESLDDIQWAKDNFPFIEDGIPIACIIIRGNEDAPRSILVYERNHVDCAPREWERSETVYTQKKRLKR
jgi:hypothetical protein